jgi:hypothetical protein
MSPSATTPFQKIAERHGHQWDGGKKDDITVIVAMVDSAPGISFKRSDATRVIANSAAVNAPVATAKSLFLNE